MSYFIPKIHQRTPKSENDDLRFEPRASVLSLRWIYDKNTNIFVSSRTVSELMLKTSLSISIKILLLFCLTKINKKTVSTNLLLSSDLLTELNPIKRQLNFSKMNFFVNINCYSNWVIEILSDVLNFIVFV